MSRVTELRRELFELEQQYRQLSKRLNELYKEEKECRKSLYELTGAYGRIERKKLAIRDAERHELDKTLLPVYFKKQFYKREPEPSVLDKVTAKRIFVRRHGSEYRIQYGLDGKPIGYYDEIDMQKTFGVDVLDPVAFNQAQQLREGQKP